MNSDRARSEKSHFYHGLLGLLLFGLAIARGASTAGCLPLNIGQTVHFSASPIWSVCFVVTVTAGNPTQLVVEQPEDLQIRARSGTMEIIVDGFQFGPETLTITEARQYRIEIRTLSPAVQMPPIAIVSRKVPTLDVALDWIQAEMQATLSKQSEKLPDIDESARLWRLLDDPSSMARTHLKRGDALLNSGDSVAARQTYEEALGMCHTISSLRCAAEAMNNSGWAAEQLGEFESARQRLEEAAAAWRSLSDRFHEGLTLSNTALLFWQAGEFQLAIDANDRAARILRTRDHLAYARVLNNLGLCYLSLANNDQARLWFKRAIAIETAQKDWATRARMNLGRALMLMGRLQPAQATLNEALNEAMRQPNRRTRASVLNNLGQTLWRLHLLDPAEAKLNEALQIHRSVGDKRGTGAALHYLGLIARERGDPAGAHQLLEQAVQIRTDCGLRDDTADSITALAELELSQGDFAGAQTLAEKGATLLESVRTNAPGPALRASFYTRKRKLLDLLVETAMRPGNPQSVIDGFLSAERGRARALLDLLAEASGLGLVPSSLIEERASLRRQINLLSLRLSTASSVQEADLRSRVQRLVGNSIQVEARIREFIVYPQAGQPLESIGPLQREFLPADSAILEYHLGEQRSHLWVLKRESIQTFELPPRAKIDAQTARAIDLLGRILDRRRSPAKQDSFESAMRRLSDTLLGPLREAQLPPRLILVLDGSLHRIPFAALRVPRTSVYLGLAHDLIRAPSASYLAIGKEPRRPSDFPRSILTISDPVFSLDDDRVSAEARRRHAGSRLRDLARLPFMDDLKTISEVVPEKRRRTLSGFDANPGAVKKLPLDDFGILHFSTHAVIDDQIPELSRVALSMIDRSGKPIDGFLHPDELSRFHLAGSIVVLSACDTALGKLMMGEGLVGITGSLFHAGAAQLVLSLTEVDAQASSQFFSEAYRRLLARRPTGVERAMRFARQALARTGRWSDPYYWATFVVIGKPSEYP